MTNQIQETKIQEPINQVIIKETTAREVFTMILKGQMRLFDKEVKAQKLSGVIYLPRKYIGKKVLVIMEDAD